MRSEELLGKGNQMNTVRIGKTVYSVEERLTPAGREWVTLTGPRGAVYWVSEPNKQGQRRVFPFNRSGRSIATTGYIVKTENGRWVEYGSESFTRSTEVQ